MAYRHSFVDFGAGTKAASILVSGATFAKPLGHREAIMNASRAKASRMEAMLMRALLPPLFQSPPAYFSTVASPNRPLRHNSLTRQEPALYRARVVRERRRHAQFLYLDGGRIWLPGVGQP